MRITLIKYISKEIWLIFLTCLMVFVFIIMAAYMLNVTELMVIYGAGLVELFSLILCIIPKVILIAMPAACLTAVLLSFIRMSSDNEIIALHSSGISLYQLMSPVVLFSIICFLFSCFLTLYFTPYGNRTYESVFLNIIKTRVESQINEGIFEYKGDFVFYVNSNSPKNKIMKDVFIVNKKKGEEKTIIAKQARLKYIKDKVYIELTDYKMFTEGKAGESIIAEFQGPTDYPFELGDILETSDNKIDPDGMYPKELLEFINNTKEDTSKKNIAKLILYEMFSRPVAVFLIAIAGAPLGSHIRAHGRTKGIIISLLLFLCYIIVLILVEHLCKNGIVNPAIGTWLPVLFLMVISVTLLIRSGGKLAPGILGRFMTDNTP